MNQDTVFTIAKSDTDKMQVFGWASVAETPDGGEIADFEGDVATADELEKAAYTYVLKFRDTGERHNPDLRRKGKLIESVVLTEEKQRAIGIPEATVPIGWWVGFQITDVDTWKKIKSGEYRMFSVEGKGERTDYPEEPGVPADGGGTMLAKSFDEVIEKYNPYHGQHGHFSSRDAHTSFSAGKNSATAARSVATENQRRAKEGLGKAADYKGKVVHIDPDKIKDKIPEYKKLRDDPDDAVAKTAAAYVQQESSVISQRIYNVAVANGYHVVFDGTGSDLNALSVQCKWAKLHGVKVNATFVQTPVKTALANSAKRFTKERRYVPEDVLIRAHHDVSQNFNKMVKSGMFDNVNLVYNDGKSTPITIAKATGSKLKVTDRGKYDEFLDKANYSGE
ncbi:MAG: XkdF-like putative serine protease domain-containing protein [Eubacteriaceae bacterium]|nr:XkdF-like putative serine protease domain-containing protein [Eubacteriaceae bacterium]